MNEKEYEKVNKTINLLKANLISIIFFILVFGINGVMYYKIWGESVRLIINSNNNMYMLMLIIIFIILHEFIHGIGFSIAEGVTWKDIKLGFNIKTLTPYAHCKVPISANIYKMALLLPSIIVGFLPTIIGIVLGIKMLVFVGSFLIVGGTGDFMIYWVIRKYDEKTLIYDHPVKAGCEVYLPKKQYNN
ncbi:MULTISPECIES: DUF3267 domain-containing protein [Clostridium]|uniref:DUF3267 domain-containing protein n=2 Tax=Clostridium TaxID=1485 RepID=A0A7X5P880_CLOSG|nr:DUF3267 domain-containing protein [Clostridium sporogenes]AJD32362.1 hypothetical protein T258_92 [Clostridium botulinum Prevot_594]KOY64269.1 hypothetical protein AN649_19350 [Clostridium sporogenes]KRU45324.1 putative zincin peptidase [Clostridium sporogenes]MBY7014346.1 DUF3267 domain-containing protein [Clostridium sporogenes]MBY7066296.1 DUF3267 domain-containing protein [Clostridium sporogenes]